jgi:ABC-type sugar transport system ATPase subunit
LDKDDRTPLLEAVAIEKSFGPVHALAGADLSLMRGEVHALLGANGAGKSTLSRVISGHVRPDRGKVLWKGKHFSSRSPRDALTAGIALVLQETSLAPDLSVIENIFLPELGLPGRLSRKSMRRRAGEVLASLGQDADLPLDREVRELSSAQRQLVEIAKALALNAELIIFDEPTSSLSPGETERLFDIMAKLTAGGHALVFVSHRLEEVFAITDRVTIMREGRTIAQALHTRDLTQADIIRHMVGQELHQAVHEPPMAKSENPVVLEVRQLSALPAVHNVSFTLRRGEILGLAGLVGAGRSETVEAIFGSRPRSSGEMRLLGKPFAPRTPADAVRSGLGFVPEDRRSQSIIPDFTVRENLLLGHLSARTAPGLGYKARDAAAHRLLERLGLPADRLLDANMLNFSGGMQQKILVARWLLLNPKILILDEPTKGVDIATRSAIYAILREAAAAGTAILVVSSDFEELLALSERVIVISDGVSVAEVTSDMLDEEKLTLLAAPRSSMERNTEILRDLAAEFNGAAFWILLSEERVFCLNCVASDSRLAPGFVSGGTPTILETSIPLALQKEAEGFVREADGHRVTLLTQVHGRRGHELGWIGLTLDMRRSLPSAAALKSRMQSLFATTVES